MKDKRKTNRFLNNTIVQKFKDKTKYVFDRIKIVLANSVYPDDCNCIICDKEIPRGAKYGLCDDCYNKLTKINRECLTCGAPLENEAYYCLHCQNNKREFDFVRSCFVYDGEIKNLILNLKFQNGRWIAKYLAQMLCDKYVEKDYDLEVVVPVPISKERERNRGYNQTMLLAKPLAEKLNLPLIENAIVKVKDVEQQSRLSGKQRQENIVGAYKVINRELIRKKRVLLVDDILTTGSTMNEVAKELKKAGAIAVYGLVVASPIYKVPVLHSEDQDVNTVILSQIITP